MVIKEAISYEEWRDAKLGKEAWYESGVFIDFLSSCSELTQKATEEIAYSIVKELWESGAGIEKPNVNLSRSTEEHCWRLFADIKTKYKCLPEQYLHYAFLQWKYGIYEWEQESLWGYLKHWIKRTLKRGRTLRW